ncbi:glycosyl transferase [Actinobacillus porcitonsillarum]|uniref:Glycosyl transferase n=1 Tax=Actinobacillus porcitonsillarum TaxID=189834 RepID=A0A2U8FH00_9PAST|nr:glycosyltransferase [Actinobacillus porcitonsillarum]AWI50249.1 glycosyl transferase [Actinobacillus porcitonsillarum]
MAVKYEKWIVVCNGLFRLLGNIVKILSYPFHAVFPKKRFTIPEFSPAKLKSKRTDKITPIIWQTNYSNKVTLPMYCNYLFNRLMSLSYDYRYVSTEEREAYIKQNADERIFNAYSKLTDGAAQADFWRVFTLWKEGGIYIDIDGHLVFPLSQIIQPNDSEVLIKRRDKYTNFFLACEKGHPIMQQTLEIIVSNIENRRIEGGVFVMTGPDTLNNAIGNQQVNTRRDKVTCAQGTFTNEYFQYIDKPRSKWNYKKNEELLK